MRAAPVLPPRRVVLLDNRQRVLSFSRGSGPALGVRSLSLSVGHGAPHPGLSGGVRRLGEPFERVKSCRNDARQATTMANPHTIHDICQPPSLMRLREDTEEPRGGRVRVDEPAVSSNTPQN
jgi:hypothetical protein